MAVREIVREVVWAIIVVMSAFGAVQGISYRPKPDIGVPAGLIPECPGVMNNITVSASKINQLEIVLHQINKAGIITRKALPIISAPKLLTKDKSVDFKNRRTVVYAVGFFDSSVLPPSQAVGTAYAKRGYNVFITETFSLLHYIYPRSARLTRTIGKRLGEFLVKLVSQGLQAEKLELVGVSLGAHVVSYAAKHFYSVTGKKPSRITGLDPAGPCFRALPEKFRLNSEDAAKVDIVHTNIDGFGMAAPIGHVDIYVNGGEFQPFDIPAIPCLVLCSHIRSIIYWWLAVENPKKFIGMRCDSVQDARYANCYNSTEINYLGLETKFSRPGIFYLATNNEFPYYRGKDGLKQENEIYTSTVKRLNAEEFEI